MFGRESKPCKVYEYGCLPPIAGDDALIVELHRRQQFWNRLVEIERAHRDKVRELLAVPDDPVLPLAEKLAAVREKIKTTRQKARSSKIDIAALQEQARELREKITAAKAIRYEGKKAAKEVNKAVLDQLEKERREAVKTVTAKSDLYWCNYDEVLKDYNQARKSAMRDKTEIKFHQWDGTGKVTVRYQKGLSVPDVFGADTRLQIKPIPHDAWDQPRGVRRKMTRTVIRLRVTSDENKKPIWVELPMVMHRPMPSESEIRCASICRERIGRKWRYKAILTVTRGESLHLHGKGTVGIDLGWRQVAGGLRVAYWADNNGGHGQLVLPPEVLSEFNKLDDLRSIRDKYFNEIRADFGAWAADNEKPDWLAEELKNLHAWRSPRRLVALIARWRGFDGDREIFDRLECWCKRENHLYDWKANLQDQVQRRRREIYRIFAAGVARRYGKAVLEDFDLRRVAKKPEVENGAGGALPMGRQRFIASVSELRLALKNACQQSGAEIVMADAKHSTTECYKCGHQESFDASSQIWRTCPKCGELWDQDHNAAINLLHRDIEFRKSATV